MAWNTEETRRRLKEAATVEFAAHGLKGTTMDSVARRAGINKERLYHYFGDKEGLYAAVLDDELELIAEAVPLDSLRDLDVGEFAGKVFDYHASHPQLARLLHWEGLEGNSPVLRSPEGHKRTGQYQGKVTAFAAAQQDGLLTDEFDAAHLVFLVIALAAWWFAVPQVVEMLTGAPADRPEERSKQREAVVLAARRIALPQYAQQPG